MLFHSTEFLFAFLPITVIGFFLLGSYANRRTAIGWLVLASLLYYGWWNPKYLSLMIATLLGNYFFGILIEKEKKRDKINKARMFFICGVVLNIGALGFFKYFGFFLQNLSEFGFSVPEIKIILPLAISFFTFQQIAYLADVHSGRANEHNFLDYCLFVTFFPQLIAGPIVHHSEVMPQFQRDDVARFKIDHFNSGITIFLLGLFKKVIIADGLAPFADGPFDAVANGTVLSFYEAWAASLSFTVQLYFDFSGYSDMAIGLAMLFGIRLPKNFDSPHKSLSIIEFWRRWHITLSNFLKDYVYIPLGGSSTSKPKRYMNIMITFTLSGLWHGAAWTYVIWGVIHGLMIVLNYFWRDFKKAVLGRESIAGEKVGIVAAWALTFLCVSSALVIFRANSLSAAGSILYAMVDFKAAVLPTPLIELIPSLGHLANPQAIVQFLGGGTIMGLVEFSLLFSFAIGIIIFGRTLPNLSFKTRVMLLVPTFYFTVQKIIFDSSTIEFLYFQF